MKASSVESLSGQLPAHTPTLKVKVQFERLGMAPLPERGSPKKTGFVGSKHTQLPVLRITSGWPGCCWSGRQSVPLPYATMTLPEHVLTFVILIFAFLTHDAARIAGPIWLAFGALVFVGSRISARERVLGRVTDRDLQEAYRTATVFCLPSERSETGDQEGVPVALMEAMADGLPVVATRHAGIPELVEETLVEEGDATGLARALQRIGEDPALAARQGRRNREIIESRFSRRNVFQLKQLFEGLVNDPR